MNWVDAIITLALAFSVITGFSSGFARTAVGFAATLAGIFFGFWCYGIAAAYIGDYVESREVANLLGFFAIYTGIVLLGAVVGRLLAMLFKWIGLSWLDRLLGAAAGVVRGLIIAAGFVTVLMAFAPDPPPRSIVESRAIPYVVGASNLMAAATPHEVKDAFRQARDKVEKAWAAQRSRRPPLRRQDL